MALLTRIFGKGKSPEQKRNECLMAMANKMLHSVENNLNNFTPKEKVIILNRLNYLLLDSLEIEAKTVSEKFTELSDAINDFKKQTK